tara:strand:- start:788 stop:1384 length:597 start_codon:yes stop_codon:yes gene_type:complete
MSNLDFEIARSLPVQLKSNMLSELQERYTHKARSLNIKPSARRLFVSIESQTCWLDSDDDPLTRTFRVSTGTRPPSNQEGSNGTPTGLHRIQEKIGGGSRVGTVFKGRVSIGKQYEELDHKDREPNLITTRILWLSGLEPGHNQGPGHDSYERYIYFHGTNHEDKIGEPSSGGCIQLLNTEIIELFDLTTLGDHVYIS